MTIKFSPYVMRGRGGQKRACGIDLCSISEVNSFFGSTSHIHLTFHISHDGALLFARRVLRLVA